MEVKERFVLKVRKEEFGEAGHMTVVDGSELYDFHAWEKWKQYFHAWEK